MSIDLAQIFKEDIQSYSDEFTEELNILKIQFFKKINKLKVIIKSDTEMNSAKEDLIKKMIQKKLGISLNIELVIFKDISNITLKQISEEYWLDLINTIILDVPVCKECLKNSVTEVNDDNLCIYVGND
jgi:DNA polymerase-3 subunit alpha (Gram-positive type)